MSFILNAIKYHRGLPHQDRAWEALWASLPEHTQEEFKAAYRGSQAPFKVKKDNPLDVTYFYQNDNAGGTGYRECFSSTCAMLAAYFGKVTSDDQYNSLRAKYGDTTSPTAQLKALESLGLNPVYSRTGSLKDIEAEIDAGRPVAVGWLHKGTTTAPHGGGHWSAVVGYTDQHLILHDPNGEANLVGGGYVRHTGGAYVMYSKRNFLPRWEVEGPGTGWYISCTAE